jgi:hypothetical protein
MFHYAMGHLELEATTEAQSLSALRLLFFGRGRARKTEPFILLSPDNRGLRNCNRGLFVQGKASARKLLTWVPKDRQELARETLTGEKNSYSRKPMDVTAAGVQGDQGWGRQPWEPVGLGRSGGARKPQKDFICKAFCATESGTPCRQQFCSMLAVLLRASASSHSQLQDQRRE